MKSYVLVFTGIISGCVLAIDFIRSLRWMLLSHIWLFISKYVGSRCLMSSASISCTSPEKFIACCLVIQFFCHLCMVIVTTG